MCGRYSLYSTEKVKKTFSVTELTKKIKFLLEEKFISLRVEGEISNVKKASSGHLYFILKDEKSQIRNKEKGLKILRSRIYEYERKKLDDERSKYRKSKIGTGDRSERIRTYNYPQGRITDHRINLTLHKLDEFMEGEIFDELVENLVLRSQEEEINQLV